MATRKISKLNQFITVNLRTGVKQPDGSIKNNWNTERFSTRADIIRKSTQQGYENGVSEADTYYMITYRHHPDRIIQITDQIHWNGKLLKPVGNCEVINEGTKTYLSQRAKHTSV